jgi:23S rRNA (guanosine2251-2'-O)-methyltransferase
MARIVCGRRAVLEVLRADPARVAVVYLADASRDPALAEIAAVAARTRVVLERAEAWQLDAHAGGTRHQGAVAIAGDYPYRNLAELLAPADSPTLLVVCDEIQDPHNVGAIVRSAVFFGATGVVLGKVRCASVTPGAVRASAGATEHARIARVTNIAETLRDLAREGLRTVGLDAEAPAALSEVDLTGPVALVVGSEGRGLRRLVGERCDTLAHLPGDGAIASLNASVACAIALYEVRQQRTSRGGPDEEVAEDPAHWRAHRGR